MTRSPRRGKNSRQGATVRRIHHTRLSSHCPSALSVDSPPRRWLMMRRYAVVEKPITLCRINPSRAAAAVRPGGPGRGARSSQKFTPLSRGRDSAKPPTRVRHRETSKTDHKLRICIHEFLVAGSQAPHHSKHISIVSNL